MNEQTTIDDGGPAFGRPMTQPVPETATTRHIPGEDGSPGMSLRDYFAAEVANAFISSGAGVTANDGTFSASHTLYLKAVAHAAYVAADAMIERRKR